MLVSRGWLSVGNVGHLLIVNNFYDFFFIRPSKKSETFQPDMCRSVIDAIQLNKMKE